MSAVDADRHGDDHAGAVALTPLALSSHARLTSSPLISFVHNDSSSSSSNDSDSDRSKSSARECTSHEASLRPLVTVAQTTTTTTMAATTSDAACKCNDAEGELQVLPHDAAASMHADDLVDKHDSNNNDDDDGEAARSVALQVVDAATTTATSVVAAAAATRDASSSSVCVRHGSPSAVSPSRVATTTTTTTGTLPFVRMDSEDTPHMLRRISRLAELCDGVYIGCAHASSTSCCACCVAGNGCSCCCCCCVGGNNSNNNSNNTAAGSACERCACDYHHGSHAAMRHVTRTRVRDDSGSVYRTYTHYQHRNNNSSSNHNTTATTATLNHTNSSIVAAACTALPQPLVWTALERPLRHDRSGSSADGSRCNSPANVHAQTRTYVASPTSTTMPRAAGITAAPSTMTTHAPDGHGFSTARCSHSPVASSCTRAATHTTTTTTMTANTATATTSGAAATSPHAHTAWATAEGAAALSTRLRRHAAAAAVTPSRSCDDDHDDDDALSPSATASATTGAAVRDRRHDDADAAPATTRGTRIATTTTAAAACAVAPIQPLHATTAIASGTAAAAAAAATVSPSSRFVLDGHHNFLIGFLRDDAAHAATATATADDNTSRASTHAWQQWQPHSQQQQRVMHDVQVQHTTQSDCDAGSGDAAAGRPPPVVAMPTTHAHSAATTAEARHLVRFALPAAIQLHGHCQHHNDNDDNNDDDHTTTATTTTTAAAHTPVRLVQQRRQERLQQQHTVCDGVRSGAASRALRGSTATKTTPASTLPRHSDATGDMAAQPYDTHSSVAGTSMRSHLESYVQVSVYASQLQRHPHLRHHDVLSSPLQQQQQQQQQLSRVCNRDCAGCVACHAASAAATSAARSLSCSILHDNGHNTHDDVNNNSSNNKNNSDNEQNVLAAATVYALAGAHMLVTPPRPAAAAQMVTRNASSTVVSPLCSAAKARGVDIGRSHPSDMGTPAPHVCCGGGDDAWCSCADESMTAEVLGSVSPGVFLAGGLTLPTFVAAAQRPETPQRHTTTTTKTTTTSPSSPPPLSRACARCDHDCHRDNTQQLLQQHRRHDNNISSSDGNNSGDASCRSWRVTELLLPHLMLRTYSRTSPHLCDLLDLPYLKSTPVPFGYT